MTAHPQQTLRSLKPMPASQRARARASECREMAAHFRLGYARRQMLRTADIFERIAREAEQREIASGITGLGRLVCKAHWAG